MMVRLLGGSLPLAVLCALAATLSGIGYRLGWWSLGFGFNLLRLSAIVAVGACVLGVAAAVVSLRRKHRRGFTLAAIGALIAAATFAMPGYMLLRAKALPVIHDITTDTDNPPALVAVLPLRAGAPNSPRYGGPDIAALQRAAYPDIVPYVSADRPEQAFAKALTVAREMGWSIVAVVPAEGRIEATDTTLLYGFKDDVVIRVTPAALGSRIDIRSVSRLGKSDVGTNARRIAGFLARLARQS